MVCRFAAIVAVLVLGYGAAFAESSAWQMDDYPGFDRENLTLANYGATLVVSGVQAHHRVWGQWPSSWREVVEAQLVQIPLLSLDGQIIDPDDGTLDSTWDLLYLPPTEDEPPRLRMLTIAADASEGISSVIEQLLTEKHDVPLSFSLSEWPVISVGPGQSLDLDGADGPYGETAVASGPIEESMPWLKRLDERTLEFDIPILETGFQRVPAEQLDAWADEADVLGNPDRLWQFVLASELTIAGYRFARVHGRPPVSWEELLDSRLAPIGRNAANRVTGGLVYGDGRPDNFVFLPMVPDLEDESAAATPLVVPVNADGEWEVSSLYS